MCVIVNERRTQNGDAIEGRIEFHRALDDWLGQRWCVFQHRHRVADRRLRDTGDPSGFAGAAFVAPTAVAKPVGSNQFLHLQLLGLERLCTNNP
jgi:hypothetical protein